MKKSKISKRFIANSILFIITSIGGFFACDYFMKLLGMNDKLMSVVIALCISLFLMASQLGKKKREFKDIEHGSARWATEKDIEKFIDIDYSKNVLLSNTVRMSIDGIMTRRNSHVLVFGGSGSGKSRYFVKPNIMQMNTSYIIIDPKGEHLASEAKMLEDNGYEVKVFDIVDLDSSMRFNPLRYFKEIKDIRRFVNILIANTSGDTANQNNHEDFWVKAERLWLMACLAYIHEDCLEEDRNINSLIKMLDNSMAKDDDEDFKCAIDIMFDDLEQRNPDSFAVKQYKKYKLAAGKTAKSILVSLGVRLGDFDIPEIASVVSEDELELDLTGDRKTALFIIIDDSDTTYNYFAAILLDVLFNVLKKRADKEPNQSLKVPVQCYLDEIANIGRIPNLHILIAVLRSRGIALHPIFQSISQLKAVYDKNWSTIEANCDTTLFLGGKGEEVQKYVSGVMTGKATIDTKSYGGSGSSGSFGINNYNYNEQKAGRNLLDENEVSKIPDDKCIVSIRGLEPFMDCKIKTEEHKNYKHLADTNHKNVYDRIDNKDIKVTAAFYDIPYTTQKEVN